MDIFKFYVERAVEKCQSFILAPREAEKSPKTKWQMFCGTPCTMGQIGRHVIIKVYLAIKAEVKVFPYYAV